MGREHGHQSQHGMGPVAQICTRSLQSDMEGLTHDREIVICVNCVICYVGLVLLQSKPPSQAMETT